MRNDKICTFAALLSLTFIACGEEISHTELVADLGKNHIVHTLGGQRPAFLVLPAGHDPETPIPLVLSLHGFTSHSAQHDRYFGLSKRVNADRFALIMANGTRDPDGKRFWNATDFCCDLHNTQVDDVKYLSGLLEEAATHIAVERIFALGHSNGGFMSYRLACEGIPGLAAIASLAGTSFSDPSRCAFASPVSVLQIHGTNDKVVAYDGSTGENEYAGAEEVALRWAALARCDLTDPETLPPLDLEQKLDGPETVRTRYRTGCRNDVTIELWTIEQGAHVPHFAPDFGQRLLEWLFNASRTDTLS